MAATKGRAPLVRRRIFEGWSLAIPEDMAETFVTEGGYWHAFADDRSVSFSSMVLTERGMPVPASDVAERMPPSGDGDPVDRLPAGLLGWGRRSDAIQPAMASRVLSGMLATDGRVAIVTITCDDGDWALDVWLSIRTHECPVSGKRPARHHRPTSGRIRRRR